MSKRALAATVTVAILGGLFLWSLFRNDGRPSHRIRISGTIELTEVHLAFKTGGRVAEVLVQEGEAVSRGALLARLDSRELESQLKEAEAARRASLAQLQELQALIRYQESLQQAQTRRRSAELRRAQAFLNELLAGSREAEIEAAEALVESAQANHEKAEKDWQRAQELYRKEDISRAQYDAFRSAFQAATAQLRQAREQLTLVREGARPEAIEQGRAQVQAAQAALEEAQALALEVERHRKGLQRLQAQVEQAEAQLQLLRTRLQDTELRSPLSGVVLVRSVEAGEVVGAGVPVLSLGDLERPWMRGFVEEPDLGRIRLGAPVQVTSDSYPNKIYEGTVSFIASQAEFTPKEIQTQRERVKLVYRIKVQLENPNQELKLNMPVEAVIEVAQP